MKQTIFLFAFLLAITFSSSSQFYGGAKVGVNFSNLTGDLGFNYTNEGHTGFVSGICAEYEFNDYLNAGMDIFYSRKGAEIQKSSSSSGGDRLDRYFFSYLQIPLLAKGGINIGDGLRAYGIFGPYFAFLVGGKADVQGLSLPFKEYELEDFFKTRDQDFSTFDIGLTLGAGVALSAGPGRAFIEFRFEPGLQQICSDDNTLPVDFLNIGKNQIINLSGGYLYEF
jgi:hypothetical protein